METKSTVTTRSLAAKSSVCYSRRTKEAHEHPTRLRSGGSDRHGFARRHSRSGNYISHPWRFSFECDRPENHSRIPTKAAEDRLLHFARFARGRTQSFGVFDRSKPKL